MKQKISIIGAGAMGGSTAMGLMKSGIIDNSQLMVADPCQDTLSTFKENNVAVTADNKEATAFGDIVMVFVKPWLVEKVLTEIKGTFNEHTQTLVVVAAGIKGEQVKQWMGKDALTAFLAIPNIAIAHLASMTFLVPIEADSQHTETVKGIFDSMGKTIVTEEKLLAAGTTLASCGIAYAMRYIRASVEGGVELGFKAADAEKIVEQTVKGAVELLQASGEHPESAIDKVTTPGGVTIRGLNEMEHAGFTSAVIRGLKAGASQH